MSGYSSGKKGSGGRFRGTVWKSHELMKILSEFQKKVSWGRPDAELEDVKARIFAVPGYSRSDLEQVIREHYERGLEFKRQWEGLNKTLRRDLFSPQLAAALDDDDILPEVKEKLRFWLGDKAESRLDVLYSKGEEKAFLHFLDQVIERYPCLKSRLEHRRSEAARCRKNARSHAEPAFVQDSPEASEPKKREHRINLLTPREGTAPGQGWTLWIDESGEIFESSVSGQSGRKGRMTALLLPADSALQPLGTNFHAAALELEQTNPLLNRLLAEECGVFGIGVDSTAGFSREGWYGLLHKVAGWVMRLLPCPDTPGRTVALDIYVEERADFTMRLDPFLLKKELSLLLGKERGERSSRIILRNVKFEGKGSGMLGWVDLLANYWGSGSADKKKLLRVHGLPETCLFADDAAFLESCESAMHGMFLSGGQWRALMERPDAAELGSLAFLALEELKKSCLVRPEAWKIYIDETAEYLAEKKYDLNVLDRQTAWLRAADDASLPSEVRFFAKLTELARFNHEGVIASPELEAAKSTVEQMAGDVALVHPQADLHAALRLAVCDANAFDFEKASARLDPWNPARGGERLRGEMAGKLLSSLGQYEAFQRRYESASLCFDLALKEFGRIAAVNPGLAQLQTAQTASYAAVNAMDAPGCTQEKAAAMTSRALGLSIMEAVDDPAVSADRFRLYLLLRYLVLWGTQREREACLKNAGRWLDEDKGRRGYPWPLIWYYRRLLAKDDAQLCRSLEEQLLRCRGESGITVDFICLVLEVSLGLTDPADPDAAALLDEVDRLMPRAASAVAKIRAAVPGQTNLVSDVLSFNYR